MKRLTANQVMNSPCAFRYSVAPDAPTLLVTCKFCYSWGRRRKDGDYDFSPSLIACRKTKAAKK